MPTLEQMKLRDQKIEHFVKLVAEDVTMLSTIPTNLKAPVMTLALARGIITVNDIPPKLAGEVLERFLKEAPYRELNEAAAIGTNVHEIFEILSLGEVPEFTDYPDHANSWKQFAIDWEIEVVRTEFTVFSEKHGYAGTGDIIFRSRKYPELGLILGDYKSSKSGIWPDIALQLAAIANADFIGVCRVKPHDANYVHLPHDVLQDRKLLPQIQSFVGIQITAEGYKVVPVNVTQGTFRVFLAAQVVAKWKTEYERYALGSAEFVKCGAA